MQRFVALLTDFECEPDPLFEGKICDKCMSCARACSGKAISMTETDYIDIAGRHIEFGKLDNYACFNAYRGGVPEYNPFDVEAKGLDTEAKDREMQRNFGYVRYMRHNHALEGARGCMRECYIHLEKKGVLKNKFHNPFRTSKPWVIDRSQRPEETDVVSEEIDTTLF